MTLARERYSLGELAEIAGAELRGDAGIVVAGAGTLEHAGEEEISFLANSKYRRFLEQTRAAAVVLAEADAEFSPVPVLVSDNPYLAYTRITRHLFPPPPFEAGRHPSAVIDPGARIAASAWIGPCAVIGAGVEIGEGVYVGPGSVLESDVAVGDESRLVARVTLCHGTRIGRRCIIHPGAVLGSDGFGLAHDGRGWIKVPQLGRVRLGDDVEIGANTTVDRGALEDTVLADGVKLDNQIMIAHNVRVGENTVMAGCVGVAGSTHIGRNCALGGGVGIAGHLRIGDNVSFSGQSLVTRSFDKPGYYSGNLPATETGAWRKTIARLRHLDEMARRLKALERRMDGLAAGGDDENE